MAAPEWDAIDLLPLLESLGLCTQVCGLVALWQRSGRIIGHFFAVSTRRRDKVRIPRLQRDRGAAELVEAPSRRRGFRVRRRLAQI